MDRVREVHIEQHKELHNQLNELVADMIKQTGKLPDRITVNELIDWAYSQTLDPDGDPLTPSRVIGGDSEARKERMMEIEVAENRTLILKKVFNPIILKTSEGNQFVICMRDDTVEMKVDGFNKWYRANMETGEIEKL